MIQAVETALNPSTAQQQRIEAYEFIEQFKASSPLCVPVGLLLYDRQNAAVVRHTGLQLLEHAVKFNWNSMNLDDQARLKGISLHLLAQGSGSLPDEPLHIKEALSRLVVEITKREWPQKWGSLLPDLNSICALGDVQTEVVLMILLRLAEDVISMDSNLQANRKKQITQELHLHMEGLFTFFIDTLQKNTAKFRTLKSQIESGDVSCQTQAAVHQRLAEQTLLTLTGYLDWVKFGVLYSQDCIILQMLCLLLEEDSLKIPSCECLLIIASRKGRQEQRIPMLKLFSEDAMSVMLSAAQKSITAQFDERQYLFLKRLCQVLVALGEVQLFHLWNSDNSKEKPPNFRQYLEALIAFSKHESLTLPHLTNGLWLTFLRNPVIAKDKTFRAIFPSLLEIAKAKLFKVGDPDEGDSPGSVFNREDFNSEREFTSVNGQVRGETMDIIRQITLVLPVDTFLFGADWLLQRATQTPAADVEMSAVETEKVIHEWDGLTRYLDAVMSRFFRVHNHEEIIQSQVTFRETPVSFIELVRKCIQSIMEVDSKVPDILSSVTDAIQALYPFLIYNKDLVMEVLKKMFTVVLFNTTGDPKGPWSPDVLHARRHACGAIIKICKEFGELLVPVFDALKQHVLSLFVGELVTVKDRCTLTEALVIASNKLSRGKQNEFLIELLTPIREMWLGDKIQGAISSPQGFLLFIGMDQDPASYFQNDELRGRRFQVMLCVTTIMAVVRSCALLNSVLKSQTATSEGLSIGSMPNGTPYVHNPCAPHVLPLLGNIMLLANCLNSVYDPAVHSVMFPAYTAAALEMHDLDTSAIYVLPQFQDREKGDVAPVQNPIIATKSFLYHLADQCYHTMGYSASCLGHDFYSIPGLAQLLIDNVIKSLQYVPNYRLRFVLRNFSKLFILHCPECDYQNVMIPVLSPFFCFMLQHLEGQWQIVRQHQAEKTAAINEEDDMESKEIIEDQLVSIISKDYLDIFTLACIVNRDYNSSSSTRMEVTEEEELKGLDPYNARLGSLGLLLLRTESVNMQMLCTVFACMTWSDSAVCHKAARLAMSFIREVVTICREAGSRIADSVVEQLFSQVLKGLHVHGKGSTETYLTYIGQNMYELLRPQYSSLQQILLQSNCSLEDLHVFEASCFEGREVPERRRKELFRKLVSGVVGKHVGELFKNEITIKDLPPIKIQVKPEPKGTDDLTGLTELFDPSRSSEVA
ncbi:Exportin-5 [Desmophyllum pertusum]|uniref:Exportin-5 n=1 Tax=Desmophyllum pertusum TaxID=174260 RepID=A0A9X0CM14_9CNID|nr:Exportin-5 [Desmophyllum pertusum]